MAKAPEPNVKVEGVQMMPASILDAPEVRAAIEEASRAAAAEAMAAFEAKLAAMQALPVTPSGDPLDMLRTLAAEIAKVNDQGSARKIVPPEIMAAREKAHEKMNEAIARVRAVNAGHHDRTGKPSPERPLYQVRGKMFFSDRFIEPFTRNPRSGKAEPTRIRWMGPPNQLMAPLNDAAKDIHAHFMKSIGSVFTEEKAKVALWVTHNGLVIEAGKFGGMERTRHGVEREEFEEEYEPEVEVVPMGPGEFDPNRGTLQVLGTIADAAISHNGVSKPRPANG